MFTHAPPWSALPGRRRSRARVAAAIRGRKAPHTTSPVQVADGAVRVGQVRSRAPTSLARPADDAVDRGVDLGLGERPIVARNVSRKARLFSVSASGAPR